MIKRLRNAILILHPADGLPREAFEFMYTGQLYELLNNPHDINWHTFDLVQVWEGIVVADTLADAWATGPAQYSRHLSSELRRKIKEGCVKWNGKKVADIYQPLDFLKPGWGVSQIGKRDYQIVLDPKRVAIWNTRWDSPQLYYGRDHIYAVISPLVNSEDGQVQQ
jgi:hypothetical protein